MTENVLPLSTITVAVSESGRPVRTTCPHCHKNHGLLLAATPEEGAAMTATLAKLDGYSTVSYGTRKARRVVETRQSTVKRPRVASNDVATVERPPVAAHTLRPRFRYFAVDRRRTSASISPSRKRIYDYIAKTAQKGMVEADLLKKGIPHGTIQQTVHWLREQGWVRHSVEAPVNG